MDTSLEMLKVIDNKIGSSGADNLKTLYFDLEKEVYKGITFDLVFNQMVLHHINDLEDIMSKFYSLINPGGFLAIADLYPEDGSFHGKEFTGHKGFDPEELSKLLLKAGFSNIIHRKCYVIDKKVTDNVTKHYNVFLLIANRNAIK